MEQAFQSFLDQEDPSGPSRGALRSKLHQFVETTRLWVGTVALVSALVVLSVIVHWSP